jgi:hypothetical protein
VTDAHIRILQRIARQRRLELDGRDAADHTRRTLDGDGGTCSNPRHEPQNVSPKPKRDGATCDRILTDAGRRDPKER